MPCDQAGPGSSPDNPFEVVDSPRAGAGSKRRLVTPAPAPSTKAKVVVEISDDESESESGSEPDSETDDEWRGFGVGPECFAGKCPTCKGEELIDRLCEDCTCGSTTAMLYCGHCKCMCNQD